MTDLVIHWLVILSVYLLFVGVIGRYAGYGSLWGVLIDSRGRMSLSRFQLFIWTSLLVPLMLAVSLRYGTMAIDLPTEVWALMGISVGSAVGSIAVNAGKEAAEPDGAKVAADVMAVDRAGILKANGRKSGRPGFMDIFLGEEIADYKVIDISRLQMFLFTLVAFIGYVSVLWSWSFAPVQGVIRFPLLSESLVTIVAISHGGYLAAKLARKTPTA